MRHRFLKFRNEFGQVTVAYEKEEKLFKLGASFCNPKDFNLPRKTRVARGEGIALSRLQKTPLVLHYAENGNHEKFRKAVLMLVAKERKGLGIKKYHGKEEKAKFDCWFKKFLEKELHAE